MADLGNVLSVYLVYEGVSFGVNIKKTIKYIDLVDLVKKKFKLNWISNPTFTYEVGAKCVHITDNDDLSFFANDTYHTKGTPHTLFIKNIENTSDSSSKPLDFDLNLPIYNNNYPFTQNEKLNNEYEENWDKNTLENIFPPDYPERKHKQPIETNSYGASILEKGTKFDNKELCMYEIGLKALKEGYQFRVRKSDPKRYDVVCYDKGCTWKIVSKKMDYTNEFVLGTVNDHHTCTKNPIGMHHRNATKKLMGHLLVPKLKDPARIYKGKEIQHDINSEFNINLNYKQACRAKNVALESISGCPVASFAQLPFYCHNLKMTNDGTVTHIETDDQNRFKMVFIAFGVSIQSFRHHMRPLLVIDAAHLKGRFRGTNLVAVGMDGNNQIIPIATGVCQSETVKTWAWFLSHLKDCIGENPELAIISDRHAGILSAVESVFPKAFHGYCCRHLMMNCKLKSEKLEAIFWRMCKAYTAEEFNKEAAELGSKKPKAMERLIEAGVERWSRAYCTSNRYNYMTSNYVESINSLTRHVRKYPITNLMDWYTRLVQKWYCGRRDKYKSIIYFICL